jgi:hypothetical protein
MKKQTSQKPGGWKAAKDLTLTITIPAKAVPLFRAMVALHIADREYYRSGHKGRERTMGPKWEIEDVAAHGLVRWMVSEESVQVMDDAVNRLLND